VKLLATSPEIGSCFAQYSMTFAYGRPLSADMDACNKQSVLNSFSNAGLNVKQLLLAVTQSDAFLYRPAQ
jgi:hypothetical protein